MLRAVDVTYPQPIAQAYGRVVRSLAPAGRLDAVLRCAEVAARYVAALGVASYGAREAQDDEPDPPASFEAFRGHLAFGHFSAVAYATTRLRSAHPCQVMFTAALGGRNNPARARFDTLIRLRNDLGHDLQTVPDARAQQILDGRQPRFLAGQRPEVLLDELLTALEPLCVLPLVHVGEVTWREGAHRAVCQVLMGEGEPMPETLALGAGTPPEPARLYVGVGGDLLSVHPKLLWDYEADRATHGVYLVDHIDGDAAALGYRSVSAVGQPMHPPEPAGLVALLEGNDHQETCPFLLADGRSLDVVWGERRGAILHGDPNRTTDVVWDAFDAATLAWYAGLLRARHALADGSPAQHIREMLLDGRGEVTDDEARQLRLLFGRAETVRQEVGRPVIDLRARATDAGRWNARDEMEENLLVALRRAVPFISLHDADVGAGLEAENLDATTGTADYLAVREALVNLLVHQDYEDRRMAGQVEIVPYQTTLINPGCALIEEDELLSGGNLSRNPLIARAFKRIGFAELAGSGLRELDRTWRGVGRPRPLIRSDREANRFSITLDARALEAGADAFWRDRAGVEVSQDEGRLLGLLGATDDGLTRAELAIQSGIGEAELAPSVQRFVTQGLAVEANGRVRLNPPFVTLARAADAAR